MMRLLAASPGSLPLPAGSKEPLRQLIEAQLSCALDLLTDGQLNWRDPISHLAAQLTGLELGEAGSFLDTKQEILRPRVRGPFAWAVPVVRPEFERAQAASSKPVKAVLTGALTLARYSTIVDPYYRQDYLRLVTDYNEALFCEVRELAAAGASVIQIDEPGMLQDAHPGEWRLVKSCLRRLGSAKRNARLLFNPGWGDPLPVLEELLSVPADIIAFDLTRNSRLGTILAHAEIAKPLQLGIVDAWTAGREDASALAKSLESFVAESRAPEVHLSASWGMRHLSTEAAMDKLRVLAEVRDLLQGAA